VIDASLYRLCNISWRIAFCNFIEKKRKRREEERGEERGRERGKAMADVAQLAKINFN
jgi:hypothetical protein